MPHIQSLFSYTSLQCVLLHIFFLHLCFSSIFSSPLLTLCSIPHYYYCFTWTVFSPFKYVFNSDTQSVSRLNTFLLIFPVCKFVLISPKIHVYNVGFFVYGHTIGSPAVFFVFWPSLPKHTFIVSGWSTEKWKCVLLIFVAIKYVHTVFLILYRKTEPMKVNLSSILVNRITLTMEKLTHGMDCGKYLKDSFCCWNYFEPFRFLRLSQTCSTININLCSSLMCPSTVKLIKGQFQHAALLHLSTLDAENFGLTLIGLLERKGTDS